MRIITLAYNRYPEANDAEKWIDDFRFYNGIWEAAALHNEVINLSFINYEGTMERRGIRHIFQKQSKRSLLFPFALHRQLAAMKPDVVFVHSLLFPLQVLLLRRQLGDQVKIVVQHHAELPFRNSIKKLIQRMADKSVDAYFFTGRGLAASWIDAGLISPGKVKEVMEVSSVFEQEDKAQARIRTGIKATHAYLWIGHLIARKDPLLVVKAFLRFVALGATDAALYMVFQSNALLGQLQEELDKHPEVAGAVHLVGKIPHPGLQSWCSAADYIISSSHHEGSGIAVCEGMSCGCIPVLSDIPSFRFMTGNGQCGFLYEAGNEDALLHALQATRETDKTTAQQQTLAYYREHLSFEAVAADIQTELALL